MIFLRLLLVALLLGAGSLAADAQSMPGGKKRSGSVEGTPLDTILSTRLWTTPPPAKDFVRETRPDPGSLDYTPLYGVEPQRPKPRDETGVKTLQAEMERDIQANEKRAQALGGVAKAAAPAARKKGAAPAKR